MLPLHEIETVFLDAGNTLVSIDFAWVQRECAARGFETTAEALLRAEAAARPAISARIANGNSSEGESSALFFLRTVLGGLPNAPEPEAGTRLAAELEPVLRVPGQSDRLWCSVLPGVPEALAEMAALGLQLVVVSNADGTVERSMRNLGLIEHLSLVIDSHVVGHQKPDPRIFEIALERAGARPEATLHVGDLYAADVLGARSANCHALLLDPFGDWPEVDCAVLPDLTGLARAFAAVR